MDTSTSTVLIELASILFIGLFLSSVSLLFLMSKSTARTPNNVFPVFVCVRVYIYIDVCVRAREKDLRATFSCASIYKRNIATTVYSNKQEKYS